MKLPQKQQAGVQRLAQMPTGAAAAADRANIDAGLNLAKTVGRAAEFTTEMAELQINRAVSESVTEFALGKSKIERDIADTPYKDATDLPEKYEPVGGRTKFIPDGEGGMTEVPRQVPSWEFGPEQKRDQLLELAEQRAKSIPSTVARNRYMVATKQAIDEEYTKDYENRAKVATTEIRKEEIQDINTLRQQEEFAAVKFKIQHSNVFSDREKKLMMEEASIDEETTTIYNSIAADDTDLMVEQLNHLKKADKYTGNLKDEERLKYIGMLERALDVKDNINKQEISDQIRDYMAARTDGNAAKDPRYMDLAKTIGMESELQAAEIYGDQAFQINQAGAEDFENRVATALAESTNITDYRLRQQYQNKIQGLAAYRNEKLATDPAGFATEENTQTQAAWATFNAAMASGDPIASRTAWGVYKNQTIAEQERLGVPEGGRTLIPATSGFSQAISAQIESAPTGEKANTVRQLMGVLGADTAEVALELAPTNMAFTAAVFNMKYDPVTSENILAGINKAHTVSNDAFTDAFNNYYGAVKIDQGMEGIMESAKMHYLGTADPKQLADLDEGLFQQSVNAVVGEPMIGYNNSGTPTATFRDSTGKFVDNQRFKKVVNYVNDSTLAAMGADQMYVGGTQVSSREVMQDAILIPVGHGKYQLELLGSSAIPTEVGGDQASIGYVADASGAPVTLDLLKVNQFYSARTQEIVIDVLAREAAEKKTREEMRTRDKAAEDAERMRMIGQ